MSPTNPIPNDPKASGRVIYTAPPQMVRLVKMIKRLSISTTAISAGLQPFLYQKLLASGSTFAVGFTALTCAGIMVSPLLLNILTKRYVTQLRFDDEQDQFTAHRLSFFNRPISVSYKPQEVRIPETLGIFTTYTVGERRLPLFVDPNLMLDIQAYKRMIGFDKPIDLKAGSIVAEMRKLKQMKA